MIGLLAVIIGIVGVVESRKMRPEPKHIYLPFIPTNKTAVTIYPYIFWSKKKRGWLNSCIIEHEMFHWYEQKRWATSKILGLSRWLILYIIQWFWFNLIKRLPTNKHPMEKPAYEIQNLCEKKIL